MVSRDDLREVLDPETPERAARWLRAWHFLAVFAGVAVAVAASVDGVWSSRAQPWLVAITLVLLAAFAVLYGLRLWVAGDEQLAEGEAPTGSRWRYAASPMGAVDLS